MVTPVLRLSQTQQSTHRSLTALSDPRAYYLDQEAIKLLTQLLGQADRNNGLQKILYLKLNTLKPSQSPKVPQLAKKCGDNGAAVLQQVKGTDCI